MPLLRSALIAVAAVCALAGCSGAAGDPETVVEAVLEARTTADCDGYAEHFVDEDDPFPRCGEAQPVVGEDPQIGDVEVSAEEATVEVVDHLDCSQWDAPDHEFVDVFHLVVEDGGWKVEDWEPAEATSDDCLS